MKATYRKKGETYYRIYKDEKICQSVTVGGIFVAAEIRVGNGIQEDVLKHGQRISRKQFVTALNEGFRHIKPLKSKKA